MRRLACVILPLGLALFFLYAGASKMVDPVEFGRSIGKYRIIDHPWTLVAALWLPWVECLAGGALLLNRWRQTGVVILLGLLGFFEIVLAISWMRGLKINCGCLGGGLDSSVAFAFFRNIGLIAIAFVIYTVCRKENEGTK